LETLAQTSSLSSESDGSWKGFIASTGKCWGSRDWEDIWLEDVGTELRTIWCAEGVLEKGSNEWRNPIEICVVSSDCNNQIFLKMSNVQINTGLLKFSSGPVPWNRPCDSLYSRFSSCRHNLRSTTTKHDFRISFKQRELTCMYLPILPIRKRCWRIRRGVPHSWNAKFLEIETRRVWLPV
jgi:hypothetical protein